MVVCPKCDKSDFIQLAGFVRGRQRFYCKSCAYHFITEHSDRKSRKKNQVTIIDIAERLGVSASTVSRALSGKSDISEVTRQEILKTAREMDYQPNLLAQGLILSETHTIGVIIPNIERPFFASVVSGIQQVASEAGYRVMICQSNESHQTEVANVQALVASRVDGLLICHSIRTETFDHIKLQHRKGIPIIHFDRVCNEIDTPKVLLDNEGGAFLAVEHLLNQGCKNIACLAGPENLIISRERESGYLKALQKYDISVRSELMIRGDFSTAHASEGIERLLSMPQKPDGIFCMHYKNAIEIMVKLKERGIKVPEDICIVGFGDESLTAMIEPSLTTIHQNPYLVGQKAASLFLEKMTGSEESQISKTVIVAGELIVRDSSSRNKV